MQEIILNLMNQFGYFGVFFLIAFENIFPPIPSEVILAFGGFMTTYTKLSVPLVIVAATLGSLVGAYVLYFIGKILNKERLKKIVSGKVGKVLHLKREDIDKADAWFDRKGNIAVFFCRFVPIVRSLISIPAGMSEMPLFKFTCYTVVGSAILCFCSLLRPDILSAPPIVFCCSILDIGALFISILLSSMSGILSMSSRLSSLSRIITTSY